MQHTPFSCRDAELQIFYNMWLLSYRHSLNVHWKAFWRNDILSLFGKIWHESFNMSVIQYYKFNFYILFRVCEHYNQQCKNKPTFM